jgi:CarD family transcriptional regulator
MFVIGDKIVHPMHGAGVVEDIVDVQLSGNLCQYYVLRLTGGILVKVPSASSGSIGVRPVINSKRADEIMRILPSIEVDLITNWSKRYRENLERVKSGDLIEVARVIKGLMQREREKGLSTGERKMLHSAKQILISEIVMAKCLDYQEIESRVINLLS